MKTFAWYFRDVTANTDQVDCGPSRWQVNGSPDDIRRLTTFQVRFAVRRAVGLLVMCHFDRDGDLNEVCRLT